MCRWAYVRYDCGHKGPTEKITCYFAPDCGVAYYDEQKWDDPCNKCKYKYKKK